MPKTKRPGATVVDKGTLVLVEFTVTGRGPFPHDMLRYDRCWPRTEEDSATIRDATFPTGAAQQRTIALASVGYSSPTIARWESFGWHVVDPTVTT